MPCWYFVALRRPPTCQRRITWSFSRGGCRFEPGHAGDCKPAGRGARGYRPSVPLRRTVGRHAG